MKSKQILSIEQMKQLQKLGLNTTGASMCWIKTPKGRDLAFNDEWTGRRESFLDPVPAYTLQDVLDALPGNISYNEKYYYLTVDLDAKNIYYGTTFGFDLLKGFIYKKKGFLIDAAYSMLCWCIENGYIKTEGGSKK